MTRRVHLPQEATKQQISLSAERHFRGYQGIGANVTRYDGGFARDWHEGLDFYKELPVRSCQGCLQICCRKENSSCHAAAGGTGETMQTWMLQ